MNNSKKISDIYFDLFDIMMIYNHKIWRTASLPLPLNHFVVMYFLYNNGVATITEVTGHLSISKQQMSPIIDKLLKKNLIEKKCLTNDRRFSQIKLSEKGRIFLEEHRKEQKHKFVERITNLSNDDAKVFDESVKVVKKMITKMFDSKI